MFRPRKRLAPALFVTLFFVAAGSLTLLLAGVTLVLSPHSADWADRFFTRFVYQGTSSEVADCTARYAEFGDERMVTAFCTARHSVAFPGTGFLVSSGCAVADVMTIAVENTWHDRVVTGFELEASQTTPLVVKGVWITPGETREYVVDGPCDSAGLSMPIVSGLRGVRVDTPLSPEKALVNAPSMASGDEPDDLGMTADQLALDRATERPAPSGLQRVAPGSSPTSQAMIVATAAPADAAQQPIEETDTVVRRSVSVPLANIRIPESAGGALIPVSIKPPATSQAWIDYQVIPVTAVSSQDFAGSLHGRINVRAGDADAAVVVPMVNDSLAESEESFTVRLAAVSDNLYLAERTEARVSIVDDD